MSVVIKQKNSDGTFTEVMKACQPNPRKIKVVTGGSWSGTRDVALASPLVLTDWKSGLVKVYDSNRDDLMSIPQGCSGHIQSGVVALFLTRIAYNRYLACLQGADSATFNTGATLHVVGIPSMQEVTVLGG